MPYILKWLKYKYSISTYSICPKMANLISDEIFSSTMNLDMSMFKLVVLGKAPSNTSLIFFLWREQVGAARHTEGINLLILWTKGIYKKIHKLAYLEIKFKL